MFRTLSVVFLFISFPVFLHAQKYEKLFQKAKEEYAKGKDGQALHTLNEALEIFPQFVEARLLKIEINQKLKNEVAVCWDLNVLREYGCKEADNITCSDCPDLMRHNEVVLLKDTVFTRTEIAEEMPEYPGGLEALMKQIAATVVYPTDCMENNISGKVFMRFVVERDGSISNISVMKGVENGYSLEMEAHKALLHLKPFTPAKQFGKPVRVEMSIPIVFKLK